MLNIIPTLNQATKMGARFGRNAYDRVRNPDRFIQSETTPFDIIASKDLMTVRHYHPLTEDSIKVSGETLPVLPKQHRVPLVLVPPLGVYSWIFDLLLERSLVRYMLARGYDLYLIDWGAPKRDHAHISFEHYVLDWMPNALAAIREHSGEQDVSMMGYCMGGLLSMLYIAAQEDDQVKNLITVASPIDFHKAGLGGKILSMLSQPLSAFSRRTNVSFSKMDPNRFHVPGDLASFAFKMTNPVASVTSYWDLLLNMADTEYVSRYTTVNRWFSDMVDFPGATVSNMLTHAGVRNSLREGEFMIGDRRIDLKKINSNLLAFAGDNDKIVSIEAAKRILSVTGTEDKSFHVVPGGHAGVFAGRSAASHTWTLSDQWLYHRSS